MLAGGDCLDLGASHDIDYVLGTLVKLSSFLRVQPVFGRGLQTGGLVWGYAGVFSISALAWFGCLNMLGDVYGDAI